MVAKENKMKPLKTYHMKLFKNAITAKEWFGTTKSICDNNHRWLCAKELREYFDIPEDTKEIWLRVFSKPTKHSYEVRRLQSVNDILVGISTDNNAYTEEVDCDLINDLKHLDVVYVEVQYEEILCV
jgi:hypothetical protein